MRIAICILKGVRMKEIAPENQAVDCLVQAVCGMISNTNASYSVSIRNECSLTIIRNISQYKATIEGELFDRTADRSCFERLLDLFGEVTSRSIEK